MCKTINLKPSGILVSTSGYHSTGSVFGFKLEKVNSAFHPFAVDKSSTKFALELNSKDPNLRSPPDRDGAVGEVNCAGQCWPKSLMYRKVRGLVFYYFEHILILT